jgi:chromosome segregation ATPase
MIKKLIIGGGVVLVLALLCFGRGMVSYVRTSAGYVRDAVHESVPMEFQIERARGMIDDLVPEIRKNLHVIAKEQVEVERLEKQVAEAEAGLGKAKQDIVRLKGDLESGQTIFVYAGRSYTAGEVKTDLANRFERYKTSEATLASLQGIYDARQRSLDAARQKLEGMLAERRRLEVEVENLDARLKKLAAAQTTSDYNFDDSKLSRVKELIDDLRTRLDVAERLVDAEGYLQGQIPLDEEAPEDIVEQVTEYFGPPEPATEALAHAEE